jgi:putative hydrolase of the HAD superfamily
MTTKNSKTSFIILDLDDTIYKEVNFVKSGFKAVIKKYTDHHTDKLLDMMMNAWIKGDNAIHKLLELLNISDIPIQEPLNIYHNHYPDLDLPQDSHLFFQKAISRGCKLGLITDGRTITQKNKLLALGIDNLFEKIIISEDFGSEKPSILNYQIFEETFPENQFSYFGDNTKKDFIAPAKLGWKMFCIKGDNTNIHKQDLTKLPKGVKLLDNLNQFFDVEP